MNRSNALEILVGMADPTQLSKAPALPPFDANVMAFLADLSATLLNDPQAKTYPDVVTFAFFCRKARLAQLQQQYEAAIPGRMGRGLVFHIAPSNVPINFAYSLVAALLAGNSSLVKASSQDFPQTRIVSSAMEKLLSGVHQALKPYVNLVSYPREQQTLTEAFSAVCDARIIWGGDETVRRVREAPLPPFAFDVTFPDRYSLLCVEPGAVLAMNEVELAAMAQGFYNDTFLSDQNACTSPRLVYWVSPGPADSEFADGPADGGFAGSGFADGPADGGLEHSPADSGFAGNSPADTPSSLLAQAQDRFWQAIHAYAAPRYPIEPVIAVDKLTALYRAAITLSGAERVPMADNLIARIRVDALTEALLDFRCPGGCFVEVHSPTLDGLKPIALRKVQTISYLGLQPESIRRFVWEHGLRGVDRIVPIGKTMDFSLTWDGYDLIQTLSRSLQAI